MAVKLKKKVKRLTKNLKKTKKSKNVKKNKKEEEENDLEEEEAIRKKLKMEEDEDDDGVLEVSKKSAFEKMLIEKNEIMTQLKNDEELKKAKRKMKDELFKTQKQAKLEAFQKHKLPEDLLREVPNKKNKVKRINQNSHNEEEEEEEEEDDDEKNNDDNDIVEDEKDRSDSDKDEDEENNDIRGEGDDNDYIALKSSVTAVNSNKYKLIPTSFQQAENFKKSHLFGTRVKRQSMVSYLASTEKRKARKV